MNLPASHERVTEQVKLWLETIVVGLNLCPFAKRELVKDRIRFFVSTATTEEMLVCDLEAELERLDRDLSIETCLLYTSPSPRDQRGSRMPSSA